MKKQKKIGETMEILTDKKNYVWVLQYQNGLLTLKILCSFFVFILVSLSFFLYLVVYVDEKEFHQVILNIDYLI